MVYDFSRLSITEFIDFAMDLENSSMKKYNEFSKRTSDENIKKILMNLSEVCAKHSRILLEIKKETNDEHEKQILILLPHQTLTNSSTSTRTSLLGSFSTKHPSCI